MHALPHASTRPSARNPGLYPARRRLSDPGVRFCNTGTQLIPVPSCPYPDRIVLGPDGNWSIEQAYWSIVCGSGMEPDACHQILGSRDATLTVALEPTLQYQQPVVPCFTPRALSINFEYFHAGAPAGLCEQCVRAAINRAIRQYEQMMPSEEFVTSLEIRWANLSGSTLMQTHVSQNVRNWSSNANPFGVKQNLMFFSVGPDSDPQEDLMLDALPLGTQVPYQVGINTVRNTSSLLVPNSLVNKWYGAVEPNPILIEIDSSLTPIGAAWDVDSWLGSVDANAYDFESTMIHEIGHALGFSSYLETAQASGAQFNFLTVWDVFRFETATVPIDETEFQNAARNLRPSQPAVGCTALNSNVFCFDLAQGDVAGGDGEQASHWKDRLTSDAGYIGIMDSFQGIGEFKMKDGKYLQDADIRAFDLMGYEINLDGVTPGVQPIANPTPAAGATVPAGALAVSWDAANFATSYDIYVDCSACFVSYVQRDITGTSHTIPAGILQDGAYTIVITARNWRGFASTSINVTVGVACDSIDFNRNEVFPEDQDVIDFFNVLAGGPCPYAEPCDIDFNNNTVFPEDQDVIDFFNVLAGNEC